jgi:hypothetical protein
MYPQYHETIVRLRLTNVSTCNNQPFSNKISSYGTNERKKKVLENVLF